MTVPVSNKKVTGAGNGVGTVFSFSPVTVFDEDDLYVVKVSSTGVETLLVRGTGANNYSVTLSSSFLPSTGSVTYPATGSANILATGESIVIKRVMGLTQETDLQNQGGYFPDTQENALDKLTMIDLQQQEELDRTVKIPLSESTPVTLPSITDRASKFLGFDGDGGAIAAAGTSADLTPVSAFINTLLDDANAAAARATLGLGNIDLSTFDGIFTVTDAENPWSGDSSTDTSWMNGLWITRGLYWDDTYKMLSRVEASKDDAVTGILISPDFPFETFGGVTEFRIQGSSAMTGVGNTHGGSIPDRIVWPVAGAVGGFEIGDLTTDEGQKVFGGSVLERDGDGATHGFARLIFKKIADDGTTETWFQGEQQNAYADANSATEATDADVNTSTSIRWGMVTTVTKASKVITSRTYVVDHGAASSGAVTWVRALSIPVGTNQTIGGIARGTVLTKSPYTANSTTTVAHGITDGQGNGVVPTHCNVELVCLEADNNYAVNDVVDLGGTSNSLSGSNSNLAVLKDATNITLILANNSAPALPSKTTTHTATNLTASKWAIRVTPYAFIT